MLDALCAHQPGARKNLKVLSGSRLADAELLGDEHGADPIFHEIPIDLRREMRARIFEPYARGAGNDEVAGSGIGLFAARRVIEAQGGDLWVEDAPERGAVFAFSVPLTRIGGGTAAR